MRDKMERKKESARQRKKALEDAHRDNLRRKEALDMEAAEKNAQATEVESEVRSCPPRRTVVRTLAKLTSTVA